MVSDLDRLAAILEPQAWAALGIGDTLAYQNRRTSSLRKARRFLVALMDPSEKMAEAGRKEAEHHPAPTPIWQAMISAILEDEGK